MHFARAAGAHRSLCFVQDDDDRVNLCRNPSRRTLQHLHRVYVNLVAIDVSGHGNMMSVVFLESIGILHRSGLSGPRR